MIEGISHITLAVRNLEESFNFYTNILGFKPKAVWENGCYLLAGDVWVCLAHEPGMRIEAQEEYSHIAFSVSEENFQQISERVLKSGAAKWKENRSEGNSLYFFDPNQHKLELHTGTLETRIDACRKKPYRKMKFF